MTPLRVLQVAAEVFPLVKTGGLADVMGALPQVLRSAGVDVRLLLPGMPAIIEGLQELRTVVDIGPCFGALRVRLLRGRMPQTGLFAYVIDAPQLFNRGGGPYQDDDGTPWPDNLQRYALLGWLAARLASGDADESWMPDIAHAHDWHAAMTCTYMADHKPTRAHSIFTIHNLAYQGLFPLDDWPLLGLSSRLRNPAGLEFHGQISFMKAGLNFAKRVTTVSPSYAVEITTKEFGCGLEGVIAQRGTDVRGIFNGIDAHVWNPSTDTALPANYSGDRLSGKVRCRLALQQEFGLDHDADAMLIGLVSRLTEQKGFDLVLASIEHLVEKGMQVVLQGSGDPALETGLTAAACRHPGRVSIRVGYDEARAHRLIAGSDVIAVPSRFEPCGLTQLYGLRYGSLPVVRRVGGLADTVVDGHTGFVFEPATPDALTSTLVRADSLRRDDPNAWRAMMTQAMAQDFSWAAPAGHYLNLYNEITGR